VKRETGEIAGAIALVYCLEKLGLLNQIVEANTHTETW
jgi:hypothetical protein